MADNNITFKVFVDQSSGTATIRNLKGEIQATEVPIKQLRQQFGNFVKEVNAAKFKRFKKELDSTIGSQQSFKNASGGATSAVLELGRVVQDAPYGLRGMANNITQLASQMAFATKAAGGFGKALRQMGKAMMGPLGVVFAISAVVSILETMDSSNKKAKKSSDALSETFGEESTKLMVLNEVLQDSSISMEAKTEIVKEANKEFKDLNITLDENGNITDETARKIDALSISFIKNAKARAIAKLIQDEMVEQSKIEARKAGESLKWYEVAYFGLISKIKGTSYDFSSAIKADSENQKESLKESSDAIKRYMDLLKKDDAELAKLLFGGKGKDEKTKKEKKVKQVIVSEFNLDSFDKSAKDLINAQDNVNKQIELSLAESEEEKLKIQEKYQLISLQRAKAVEIQKQKDALDAYEEKVNKEFDKEEEKNRKLLASGKITQKQFTDWQIQASQEVLDKLGEADKKTADNVAKIIKNYDGLIGLYEKLYGLRLKAIGAKGKKDEEKEIEDIHFYIEQYKQLVGGLTQFLDAEAQRQITIEQNKTNKLNEALNNRLLNENLSKDERAKIQNEIWQNDEALRKKQNEIKKKQFNTQKALNISMGIANTISAGIKASNETYGGPFARIAAMTAVIGAGLAQVAIIARQKFQPEAASTPIRTASSGAGGGGGVGDRSFNFNLVGASQQNQLLSV
jgi:hypothetical protein